MAGPLEVDSGNFLELGIVRLVVLEDGLSWVDFLDLKLLGDEGENWLRCWQATLIKAIQCRACQSAVAMIGNCLSSGFPWDTVEFLSSGGVWGGFLLLWRNAPGMSGSGLE